MLRIVVMISGFKYFRNLFSVKRIIYKKRQLDPFPIGIPFHTFSILVISVFFSLLTVSPPSYRIKCGICPYFMLECAAKRQHTQLPGGDDRKMCAGHYIQCACILLWLKWIWTTLKCIDVVICFACYFVHLYHFIYFWLICSMLFQQMQTSM